MRSLPDAVAAPSSTQFVQSVWECLGATGPTDFARKLGLGPDGLQKVRRWRSGGRLDYEDTMRMLELCGWLSLDAPASARSSVHLEELAEAAVEMLENQREILDLLRAEPQQQRRAGAPKPKRSAAAAR